MANNLNSVLERLRAFGADRLAELDARGQEHRGWLATAVADVKAQLASLAPPAAKRQRVAGGAAAKQAAAEAELEPDQVRHGRWGAGQERRTGHDSLLTSRRAAAAAPGAGCRRLLAIATQSIRGSPIPPPSAAPRPQGPRQGRRPARKGRGGAGGRG